jgi:hypothetical protein
LLYLRLKGDFE